MSKNSKEVLGLIKLQIPYGKANPAPPIGPALGQKGLNIMEFCKQFNALKLDYEQSTPLPVTITAYKDKSFVFVVKSPPVSHLIQKKLGIKKGSAMPSREIIGRINREQVMDIVKIKISDMNAENAQSCARMIIGSAKSMGIEFVE